MLYVGGEAVATTTQTIAAGAATTVSLTFTPEEAVADTEAYIEVNYAGGTLKSEAVSVTIAAVPSISETEELTLEAGTYAYLNVNYSLKAGWNTIVLPFSVTNLSVFGEGAEAYAFSGYAEAYGQKTFSFTRATSLAAATPYVIYAPEAKNVLTFTGVTVYADYLKADAIATRSGAALFQGTYAPLAAGDMNNLEAGLTADGHIKKAGAQSSIRALHAYFELDPEKVKTVTESTTEPDGEEVRFFLFEAADGIRSLSNAESAGQLFDLSGRKVSHAKQGVFVLGGKKVVVK